MKLWQCKNCKKTCGTWEASREENICSVCFDKMEDKRLRLVSIKNAKKKRSSTTKVGEIEKIADYIGE